MSGRRSAPLRVLMFHGLCREIPDYAVCPTTRTCLIRERDFESCVRWCARTHKIVTLNDVPRYWRGEATDPGVLITFDDGLASVIDLAVPILQKHRATAVVFVTTAWIDGQMTPPIFRLERDLWEAPPRRLEVRTQGHHAVIPVESRAGVRAALNALWVFCFANRVAPVSLAADAIRLDDRPWEPDPAKQHRHVWFPATWGELAGAARAGTIEIGAHGTTHVPWSWLTDAGYQREMGEARERLQAETGVDVTACAYPHGLHDEGSRAAARQYYDWAFTTVARPVGREAAEALPRFHVPGARPVLMDVIVHWPLLGRVMRKALSMFGHR